MWAEGLQHLFALVVPRPEGHAQRSGSRVSFSDVEERIEALLAQIVVEHVDERRVCRMASRDTEKGPLLGEGERCVRVVDDDSADRQGLASDGADEPEARLAVDQDLHGGDADRLPAEELGALGVVHRRETELGALPENLLGEVRIRGEVEGGGDALVNACLAGCPETSIGVHDYAVSILWDLGLGLKPVTEDVVSDSK